MQRYNTFGSAPSFSDPDIYKGQIVYLLSFLYFLIVLIIIILQPWLKHCDPMLTERFKNPAYDDNPCRLTRTIELLYLTVEECSFGRRIVVSVILGGVIGWERREADRPAGIRTMALTSLGACLFTLTSIFAFISGTNTWDASRVSAAIPSGVGFLGAALIFKESDKDEFGQASHTVHGLTTAASVWLSAAVGIACGGEMYFSATFSVAVMLLLLRFGPRTHYNDECTEVNNCDPEKGSLEFLPLMNENGDKLKNSDMTHSLRSFRRSRKPELV